MTELGLMEKESKIHEIIQAARANLIADMVCQALIAKEAGFEAESKALWNFAVMRDRETALRVWLSGLELKKARDAVKSPDAPKVPKKRGRPPTGEKPWVALGIGRRTYFERKKAGKL